MSDKKQQQPQPQPQPQPLLKLSSTSTSAAATIMDDRKSPSISAATAQDCHPYARGAVIEVWHIPKKQHDDDDWWSSESSSSSSEEEEGEGEENERNEQQDGDENKNNNDTNNNNKSSSNKNNKAKNKSIRLCDIIDRVPHDNNSWRYYVHYRDFNRRMDEWINVRRIVSPPSIGNAKARALKRQEERERKRKLRQQLEQQEAAEKLAAGGATRGGSRRRSSAQAVSFLQQQQQQDATSGGEMDAAADESLSARGSGSRRRLSRRKSSILDDEAYTESGGEGGDPLNTSMNSTASSVAAAAATPKEGGGGASGTSTTNHPKSSTKTSDVLALPKDAGVTTTTVGEHTVATVQAVEMDEHEGLDEASLREHEEVTKIKNVGFLELGRHQMETWYFSPLPKELIQGGATAAAGGDTDNINTSSTGAGGGAFLEVLYVCEFTFRMFARKSELQRFQRTSVPPENRHPPGNEIYRHDGLAMFEVDGLEEKVYCQNLCYIAKLFLDHKTLYFDVDPFLFYVLCEVDERGYHPVGYYSKEKYSDVGYNLACILSFPAHQRKGYGRFLISFSYELTKKEEKVGSPEKPMSDLGQQAYKPYWASTIIDFLLHQSDESALSIMDISKRTSIMAEDIVYTLNQLGVLKILNGVYFIAAERSLLTKLAKKYPVKEPRVHPEKLHWTPFLTDVKRDKFSIHSKKPSLEATLTTSSSVGAASVSSGGGGNNSM